MGEAGDRGGGRRVTLENFEFLTFLIIYKCLSIKSSFIVLKMLSIHSSSFDI